MKTRTFHFLFLCILTASLSACGGGTLSDGQWTTTSSSAMTLGFEDGASDVATDASFSITCPSALNASSVTATSFFVAPNSSGSASLVDGMLGDLAFNAQVCLADSAVAGTRALSNSDMTATLTPTERLAEGTPYALCGTADLRLADGSAVAAFTALFTTRDTTRPTVTATSPSYGAYAVPTNAPVKAKFSEGMDAGTITTSSFTTVRGASAVTGTIAYSAATKLATFSPSQDLSAGMEYTATVTTAVADDSGNALAEDYAWTFTTASSSSTTPSLALSTTGVLEVSVAGTGTPLSGSGTGHTAGSNIATISGSGFYATGGSSATSGLAEIAFGGSSATNITNLTSQVTIDVADAGLSSCAVDSPFNAVSCSLAGFAITRNQLSTGLGSSATANLSATGTTTAGGTIASNALAARKCTVSQISNTRSGSADFYSPYLTVFNNALYFSAYNASGHDKLHRYDGSTITQISDTYTYDGSYHSDSPSYLTVFNNALYFSALNTGGFSKLYKCNGSTITQISNTRGSSSSDGPSYLTVFNNALYFSANNTDGYSKLYGYDGSAITKISNTTNNPFAGDSPQYLTVFNSALYFSANNTGGFSKLYKYGGSTIAQISNIYSSGNDSPSSLTVFNSALYFSAYNSSGYTKLFKYDGVSTITQISNSYNSGNDSPSYPTVFNGALYFLANNSWGVRKLFKYDGTTITQISNTRPDNVDDVPSFPMWATATVLYFPGYNSVGQPKLFKYDGANIVQVSDTCSGCSSGDGYYWELEEYNNAVYFSADAAVAGKTKLFRIE